MSIVLDLDREDVLLSCSEDELVQLVKETLAASERYPAGSSGMRAFWEAVYLVAAELRQAKGCITGEEIHRLCDLYDRDPPPDSTPA